MLDGSAAPGESGRRAGRHPRTGTSHRFLAVVCFLAAAICIAGAVFFAASGFAGPAPVALAAGGMCIAAGVALVRPPPRRPPGR
jgi:CHASE2 domain-containing sensor protein